MTLEAPPRSATKTAGHSVYFDLMRGLASQMVLVGHSLNIFLPAYFMEPASSGRLEARAGLFYMQNLGVLLFFYISGYLITSSALRKVSKGHGFLDFGADRAARIFTPLLPALVLVFMFDHLLFAGGATSRYSDVNDGLGDLFMNAAMLAGNPALGFLAHHTSLEWLSATSFGSADQLWTVIVEWWIYAVFGLAFFVLFFREKLTLTGWAICSALLAVAIPLMMGTGLNTPGLLIAWAGGMIVRIARPRLEGVPRLLAAGIGATCLPAAILRLLSTGMNLYDPITALLLAGAFFASLFSVGRLALVTDHPSLLHIVQYMSNTSYSLYLVHFSILIWIAHLVPEMVGHPVSVILAFAGCNLAAWLFYLAFERHYPLVRARLQKLIDRVPPAEIARARA